MMHDGDMRHSTMDDGSMFTAAGVGSRDRLKFVPCMRQPLSSSWAVDLEPEATLHGFLWDRAKCTCPHITSARVT
jgi:hypothetical protein